jgi:murein DD-endopeptidase MepM/ murein hydrolase activator NlpD
VLARFVAPAGPFAAGHRGVDLAASVGQHVLAAGPGTVAFSGTVAGKPVVSIDHAGGLRTTYEPVLGEVRARDRVAAGETVGRVAGTFGHCLPATCLHWGLRTGPGLTSYLDPLSLIGVLPVRLLPVWDVAVAGSGPPPWSPLPGPPFGRTGDGGGRPPLVPDRGPLLAGRR